MDIHLQTMVHVLQHRAILADEVEWASIVKAFKGLSPEHRVLVWVEAVRGVDIGTKTGIAAAKLMHKHLAGLVLEVYGVTRKGE